MGRKKIAYAGPFVVFMLFLCALALPGGKHATPGGVGPMYLVFPLQTVVCGGMLIYYWREYRLAWPRQLGLALGIALITFILWIAPQAFFHQKLREGGFDPDLFLGKPALYWAQVILRFIRLVVVVPLLEEIFWRGFLLRYLIAEDFDTIPIGAYSPRANIIVALLFMLEHSIADWPAALMAGFLYNLVAFRGKSLSSCVLAHAVTNLLLGLYVMATRQWGFW